MAFIFKKCFEANPQVSSFESATFEREESPHQRLVREQQPNKDKAMHMNLEIVPNRFQSRGGWEHKDGEVDYMR